MLGALPSLALAHGVEHPRTLTLDLSSAPARIELRLTLSRTESRSTRRLFDRDRDGKLSQAERGALTRYLEAKAWGGLRFVCDGKDAVPTRAATQLAGADDVNELQLRLQSTVTLSGGDCSLEDGGDTTGHLPVTLLGNAASLEAPRAGDVWNVPARRQALFVWKR